MLLLKSSTCSQLTQFAKGKSSCLLSKPFPHRVALVPLHDNGSYFATLARTVHCYYLAGSRQTQEITRATEEWAGAYLQKSKIMKGRQETNVADYSIWTSNI